MEALRGTCPRTPTTTTEALCAHKYPYAIRSNRNVARKKETNKKKARKKDTNKKARKNGR